MVLPPASSKPYMSSCIGVLYIQQALFHVLTENGGLLIVHFFKILDLFGNVVAFSKELFQVPILP